MVTKNERLYDTVPNGKKSRETLITNKRKGKQAQQFQKIQPVCCYCQRPGIIRVRWFFVCVDHAPAWGIG